MNKKIIIHLIFVLQSVSLCYAADCDTEDDPPIGGNKYYENCYESHIMRCQSKRVNNKRKSIKGSRRGSLDRVAKHAALPVMKLKVSIEKIDDKKSIVEVKQELQEGHVLGLVSVFETLALKQKKK